MARVDRAEALWALLTSIREAKEPCIPSEFCRRAGISRPALANYADVEEAVNAYGWESAPERMRGPRPGSSVPVNGRVSSRRQGGVSEKLRREHEALSREVEALRAAQEAARVEEATARQARSALEERVAGLERLLEVTITRLAGLDPTACRDVERILEGLPTGLASDGSSQGGRP